MTLNFAELTKNSREGLHPTQSIIADIVSAGPGATFALVELAAEFRRAHFRNMLEVVNLVELGAVPERAAETRGVLTVGGAEDPQELAAAIYALAKGEEPRITVNFQARGGNPQGAQLSPMYCLRVLAAIRLAAPEKSLRIGAGRQAYLRSLQSLALQVVDSFYLANYSKQAPTAVFEDLKLIRNGGFAVMGAEKRDLAGEYVAVLEAAGEEDAAAYAAVILADDESGAPGCGDGGCACGAGGCGGASPVAIEPAPQKSGCGCGSGACGK